MQAPKSKPTDNPWAKLDSLIEKDREPMGPEWFTVAEYAARYGFSIPGASHKLKADKRFERWTGVCQSSRRRTNKFRLK